MTQVLRILPIVVAALLLLLVLVLKAMRVSDALMRFSVGAMIGLILLSIAIAINTRSTAVRDRSESEAV